MGDIPSESRNGQQSYDTNDRKLSHTNDLYDDTVPQEHSFAMGTGAACTHLPMQLWYHTTASSLLLPPGMQPLGVPPQYII